MFVVRPDVDDLMARGHGAKMVSKAAMPQYGNQKGYVPGWQLFLLLALLLVFVDGIVAITQSR
jgi:hypothetical protein